MSPTHLPTTPSRRTVLRAGVTFAAALIPSSAATAPQERAGPDGVFDVKAFGASGVRSQNATGACQAAVDACTAAGGGTVRVPPGEFSVGTIVLKDNVTLHVEAGATVFLLQDPPPQFQPGRRAMIYAENASNIGVTGRGTLDGLAQYEFVAMRGVDPEIADEIAIARAAGVDMRRYYRVGVQAYMLILNGCRNVLLQDVAIVDSPLWTVRLNDCDRVHVRGVRIYSDLEKGVNADGIDIVSSRNVTISDSIIETADDAIVLKTIARDGRPARPTENVTVTNCILTSSSTALMIGTETEADIRHVLFDHCVIRNSNKGFGINVQDGATVSDVIVSHLTVETSRRHWNWWGSAEMCKLVLKKRTPDSRLGAIRDLVVDTVVAHPRGTSTITGHAERPIENLRLTNLDLTMLPENAPDKRATHALQLTHVRGARIRDLSVRWAEESPEPKWASALALRHVSQFDVDGFSGRQGLRKTAHPGVLIEDCEDGTVRDARALDGAGRLVEVRGRSPRITLDAATRPPSR
jgi:glycosyl hydrolase family 28